MSNNWHFDADNPFRLKCWIPWWQEHPEKDSLIVFFAQYNVSLSGIDLTSGRHYFWFDLVNDKIKIEWIMRFSDYD